MEFHENKAKQPFIGFVLIWRAFKNGAAGANPADTATDE